MTEAYKRTAKPKAAAGGAQPKPAPRPQPAPPKPSETVPDQEEIPGILAPRGRADRVGIGSRALSKHVDDFNAAAAGVRPLPPPAQIDPEALYEDLFNSGPQ